MIYRESDYLKIDDVEYDLTMRWQRDTPHHPKSIELFNRVMDIDFLFADDYFCWKSGGDGDNGETLMYVLDVIFDEDDKRKLLE